MHAANVAPAPGHQLPLASGAAAIRAARVCIGNHFAQMEGQLLLALLAQHVTFERTNPARRLCPSPSSSWRPTFPAHLRISSGW